MKHIIGNTLLAITLATGTTSFAAANSPAAPACSFTVPASSGDRSPNEVSARTLKHFKASFAGATREKWSVTKSGYTSSFTYEGMVTRAWFNKKGNLLYTIVYRAANQLPESVRAEVRSVYYDYRILTAEEIRISHRSIYQVDMENSATRITVKVCDGEMEVLNEFPSSSSQQ